MGEKTCAGRSAFFSAGASGGSVGLTVARFSATATDPGITRAVEAIQQMADPGTLSEATDGTFIRDTFSGATGVPMPLFPPRTRAWDWTDQGWSTALEAALTAARRDDLQHGTNAAYTNGCACRDCREHQQRRMGRR